MRRVGILCTIVDPHTRILCTIRRATESIPVDLPNKSYTKKQAGDASCASAGTTVKLTRTQTCPVLRIRLKKALEGCLPGSNGIMFIRALENPPRAGLEIITTVSGYIYWVHVLYCVGAARANIVVGQKVKAPHSGCAGQKPLPL